MIKIVTPEFEIIQGKYNLYELKFLTTVNSGKDNERTEMKVYGNALTLDTAIKKIISKRLSDMEITVSLEEFIKLYSIEVNKICKLISDNIVHE